LFDELREIENLLKLSLGKHRGVFPSLLCVGSCPSSTNFRKKREMSFPENVLKKDTVLLWV
jgi:hypothetical protein